MNKKIFTIISITIFSILLWVFISLSEEHFTTITIPVEIQDLPEGYSTSKLSQKDVTLSIKGKGWLLAQFNSSEDAKFEISANLTPGFHRLDLRTELNRNTWLSSNIQVIEIVPNSISFDVEKLEEKEVSVVSNVTFEFSSGYGRVSEFVYAPQQIKIKGPRSVLDTISYLSTEDSFFGGIDKNFIADIPLKKVDNISFSPQKVNVSFEVQKIVDKTFENIDVEIKQVPKNQMLVLFPSKIDVVVRGGIDQLSKLNNKEIRPYIYFSQAYNDTLGSVQPKIDLPKFISLVDLKPGNLEYIIKLKQN